MEGVLGKDPRGGQVGKVALTSGQESLGLEKVELLRRATSTLNSRVFAPAVWAATAGTLLFFGPSETKEDGGGENRRETPLGEDTAARRPGSLGLC